MSTKSITKKYAAHEVRLLDFQTKSPLFQAEIAKLRLYLPDDRPILFVGETGVGKTALAQAAHYASSRAEKPFRDRCVGEIERRLLRSELFGHVKGAFTGATTDRLGLFRVAKGGTVFLDETPDLYRRDQAALMRVIEYRKVIPVGSDVEVDVDVRLMFATNVPMATMLASPQRWRRDFLLRLGQAVVYVPALRERLEDLQDLVERIVRALCDARGAVRKEVPKETLAELAKRGWPGNIRELDGVLRVAVARAKGPWVRPEDLPPEMKWEEAAPAIRPLRDVERELAQQAVAACGGNLTRAAEALGIGRRSLRNLLSRR